MVTFRNARNVAVGVTVGLAFVTAAPALAAPTNPGINGSAFGASVTLGGAQVVPPTPTVTLPADGRAQTASSVPVNVPSVVSLGVLNARTSGDPAAGTSTSTGSAATVDVLPSALLPSALSAEAVSATCNATSAGESGSATIVNLRGGDRPLLNANPGPNTNLTVPGLASVVLNEQINNGDGSLTVNALHVTFLPSLVPGGPLADIIVGSATCGPNAALGSISAFPTAGLPIAGGLVAAFVLGAVVLRRRQNGSVAA